MERSLQKRIDEVKKLQRRMEQLERELGAVKENITTETQVVIKILRSGRATTGDLLRDRVIQMHGFEPKVEAAYRALEEQLRGKRGEFILASFYAKVATRHVFGKGYEHRGAKCYRLGLLRDDALQWAPEGSGMLGNLPQLTLPVPQYIEGEETAMLEGSSFTYRPNVQEGNILGWHAGSFHRGNPPHLHMLLLQPEEGAWEQVLHIGDEAVKKWLKEHHMEALWKPAAEVLGRLILEPTPND